MDEDLRIGEPVLWGVMWRYGLASFCCIVLMLLGISDDTPLQPFQFARGICAGIGIVAFGETIILGWMDSHTQLKRAHAVIKRHEQVTENLKQPIAIQPQPTKIIEHTITPDGFSKTTIKHLDDTPSKEFVLYVNHMAFADDNPRKSRVPERVIANPDFPKSDEWLTAMEKVNILKRSWGSEIGNAPREWIDGISVANALWLLGLPDGIEPKAMPPTVTPVSQNRTT